MTTETLIVRINKADHREASTADGDLVIARRIDNQPGMWLVTATANDAALTQVAGRVYRNEAGFSHRQWESTIDGQQHESLTEAMRSAVSIARQRADIAAFIAAQKGAQS
jgi:hypothetical protein